MGRFLPQGSRLHGGPSSHPPPKTAGKKGRRGWFILLTYGLFFAAPVEVFAQTTDNLRTYYVPSRSFNIPFTINENDPRIEVLLNVSTDKRQYRLVGVARPIDRRFYFSAPADGEYYFIVQTRDANGVVVPDLRTASPSIRVCVDTQSPIIEQLNAVASSDNSLPTIHWKIVEPNLKEIWADYRSTSGGEWVPLFLPLKEEGEHTWKPSWGGELEVRMQALDQAGHRSEVRMLRLRAADNVTRMPPPPEPAGPGKIMYVNSKTFQLNYELDAQSIGPSEVASVDIWKLHPGQGWRKCPEKGSPRGPATITVDAAGRWGFRLIPRSGVGLAERDPQPGDPPDIWVEVDDKPPHVKVTNVTVVPEADGGYLTVYWKADDAFLRPLPITIFLASPQGGDWTAVARDLPNTGSWRQKTDELKLRGYEFALKVTAVDEAGNIGSDQWRDTVKVDLKIPRIKSIEVKPGGTTSGQQPYGEPSMSPYKLHPLDSQPATRSSPSPLNAAGQDFRQPGR
jgi:hypothetical protein